MKDLRVQRTYILLKEAFFKLLAKKPFEEIKVNDICNLAMIHRTTFYHNFQDKYDLLDFCIQDIKQELIDNINKKSYKNIQEFYSNLVTSLLEYIADKKNVFINILRHNSKSSLTEVFLDTCVDYISSRLTNEYQQGIYPVADIDVISHFYSGAVLSTIVWWLESNSSMSEAELCDTIINLIFKVPNK